MSEFQELSAKLNAIHDARLLRFLVSGLDVPTFQALEENKQEFQEMVRISARLVALEEKMKQSE